MGTPHFAVPTLEALASSGHHVTACYTRPPSVSGRGRRETPSETHLAAVRLGIPVRTPDGFGSGKVREELAAFAPDLIVVAAYGIILPRSVLSIPRLGCLNVHGSLLPRWRGAAPVQRAILAGDEETGITIIRMDAGMDTGDMFARTSLRIDAQTSGELHEGLSHLGARMMVKVIDTLDEHPPVPQPTWGVTIASKTDKSEALLDFTRPAVDVERTVRAFSPSPGAWTMIAGERVRILKCEVVEAQGSPGEMMNRELTIACGSGGVRPLIVQRAGRGLCSGRELAHALRIMPGTVIGRGKDEMEEFRAEAVRR